MTFSLNPLNSLLILVFFLFTFNASTQNDLGQASTIDQELLNQFILREVNKYRKQVKKEPLSNESLLFLAANDHSNYMLENKKVTHFQRSNIKKAPKNRVDFYGEQFNLVGENVQLNNLNFGSSVDDKKNPLIHTYEQLAKELVLSWRNSPPHYANMINPDFLTTYTSISLSDNGEVYACQLFGGSVYQNKYKEFNDTITYKPDNSRKCWRCRSRPPIGVVHVLPDRTIIFLYSIPKIKLHLFDSRMRFYNPWRDGLAADIVLKSQYTCDTNSYFNGKTAVRGIPLEPVYKKDFGPIGLKKTLIILGKVPDYIDEEFEVNVTVVQNKRTCLSLLFNLIPSRFNLEIPLDLGINKDGLIQTEYVYDTIITKLFFDKSVTTLSDSLLHEVKETIRENSSIATQIELAGYASIEGSRETNIELFNKRTELLFDELISLGIDSNKIVTTSEENFKDFRRDIVETSFEDWNQLTDNEIKNRLQDKKNSSELEFLLKNHRFVELRIETKKEISRKYTSKEILTKLQKSIDNGEIIKSLELQKTAFSLALSEDISLRELENISIPNESKYIELLHNNAVIKYHLDSLNPAILDNLEQELNEILLLNERDRRINTSLAIIEFYRGSWSSMKEKRDYFRDLKKRKFVNPEVKARIILSFSAKVDWRAYSKGSLQPRKYFYHRVKKYIKPAHLDVDKTFELASYYSFFGDPKFAFDLTKRIIDETENPDDLIYFLKLIHLNDVKIPRKTYLRYFEKIRKYSGDQFCTYFNSPALNFQIFDDVEIKEIYCEECVN